jgi:uncharacterized protein HemX
MDTPVIVALIVAASAVFGALATWIATRGRTKADVKTALDARIDERMKGELESTWGRLDEQDTKIETLKKQNKGQARQIEELQKLQEVSERRERLLYLHAKSLRDHILNELPPPPPPMPQELVEWFEQFRADDSH